MASDPSFLRLVMLVHQEKIEAATRRMQARPSMVEPSLTTRLLSAIGGGLIRVGQSLQSQPGETLQAEASQSTPCV